jgi:hypothetical protein
MNKRLRWALVVIAVAIGGSFLAWFNSSGDPLPAPEGVDRLIASGHFGPNREHVKFEIPVEQWPRIRAAMQLPKRDFSPAKWLSIGSLDITTRQGREYHVELYQTQESLGAFSAGPTFERRAYYRGGDSEKLAREMEAAYSIAVQQRKVL